MSLSIIVPAESDQSDQFKNSKTLFNSLQDVEVIYVNRSEAITRAERLNIGFYRSHGTMVLFYHPRSYVSPEGLKYLSTISEQKIWGAFTHQFDERHWLLDFTSWYSNHVRPKKSGVIYLDHCIFFHRSLFLQDIPLVDIFEDTLLTKSLSKQQKPIILPFHSTTSAVRFKANGIYRQAFYNQILKLGHHLGLPHDKMNRFYEKGLGLNSTYNKK